MRAANHCQADLKGFHPAAESQSEAQSVNERSRLSRCFNIKPAAPPPGSMEDAPEIPEARANFFSKLVFSWLTPHMVLGYRRPLEPEDLYRLDEKKQAAWLAARFEESWAKRISQAEAHNQAVRNKEKHPSTFQKLKWSLKGPRRKGELTEQWYAKDGLRQPDLKWATNDMLGKGIFNHFWAAALYRLVADCLTSTAPIVMRELISFLQDSYSSSYSGQPSPNIGKGVALSIALFGMQLIGTLCTSQFFYHGASSGCLFRAGLMKALYDRAVTLSPTARAKIPNAKLYAHTVDISRIDLACNFFMSIWAAPFQICLCLALLIVNLGYSALPGFAVFLLIFPIQHRITKMLFSARKKCMVWSDQRAKLVTEMLTGIRIVKSFSYEKPFLKKLFDIRKNELVYVRRILLSRAGNVSIAFTLPILSAVVSFLVYSASGHELTPGVIFSSFSLFQLLRQPLMMLPQALNSTTDAISSFQRLIPTLTAEVLPEQDLNAKHDASVGVSCENASFTWESSKPPEPFNPKAAKKGDRKKTGITKDRSSTEKSEKDEPPFKIEGVNLKITPGELVAIVGSVGSGKSSLISGLLGEMRRTSGTLSFGGKVAYIPQTAWAFNGSVRENILFGQPFDLHRYQQVLHDACLLDDLSIFDDGDMTEIGENGITLSGGQKQRVSIARALYFDAEVILADDCFSALDAQVGHAIFERAFRGSLKGKAVLLATHALHFLPMVDRIIFLEHGQTTAEGTYHGLMSSNRSFAALIEEFGNKHETTKVTENDSRKQKTVRPMPTIASDAESLVKEHKVLMSQEERETGSVDWKIYKGYFAHGRGTVFLPLLVVVIVLTQGFLDVELLACLVGTIMKLLIKTTWLRSMHSWQKMTFDQSEGFYMGIYAGISVAATISTFAMLISWMAKGAVFAMMSVRASASIHAATIQRVLFAPLSFFDTTPTGRVISRLTKDVETIDNVLSDNMRMFVLISANVVGILILLIIIIHWFAIAVGAIIFIFYFIYRFYASSAREVKRIDSVLRSTLYAHLAESLSGLSTIRAYGRIASFKEKNARLMDVEDRAYYITTVNQRWVSVRLDLVTAFLTLLVAFLAVEKRKDTSPEELGLSLAYIVPLQQAFSFVVRQLTMTEQNLNSAERLLHYATELEQEAAYEKPTSNLPSAWPNSGTITFDNVSMAYRPGLPNVLRSVQIHTAGLFKADDLQTDSLSFNIQAGEAVGICGRTGAGKSSILLCLLRLIELSGGRILIDGQNIADLGLETLRRQLSLIPQDPILFEGTIRTNLDPFEEHDDAALNRALQRARVLDQKRNTKLNLDTTVIEGGANLSVGERALLSLARALVKGSKVIMLDEASASLDFETDAQIQDTILREFTTTHTLLCIAHRLRTIIGYSRILVLNKGQVEEFDTPLNLFRQPDSAFREMCAANSITEQDVIDAQERRLVLQKGISA